MPYEIIRQDITKMKVDAIVNPTDYLYSGSGGADARIHYIAGPELREACDSLPYLKEGEVAVTKGFRLPCNYIIHTFGPIWQGGCCDERKKLVSCYRNSLQTAFDLGCESIAIPLISSGTFGFPKDKVLRIALDSITSFLISHDMTVYVIVFDKNAYAISKKLQKDVKAFIDEHYIEQQNQSIDPYTYIDSSEETEDTEPLVLISEDPTDEVSSSPTQYGSATSVIPKTVEEALSRKQEGFSEALLRLIDRSGMKDAECYNRANISRQLFSKIRSDPFYQPSKLTVFAFAIALKLTLEETTQLLNSAGFAFNHKNETDLIVEFFITHHKYDINEINMVLDDHVLKCLGNVEK